MGRAASCSRSSLRFKSGRPRSSGGTPTCEPPPRGVSNAFIEARRRGDPRGGIRVRIRRQQALRLRDLRPPPGAPVVRRRQFREGDLQAVGHAPGAKELAERRDRLDRGDDRQVHRCVHKDGVPDGTRRHRHPGEGPGSGPWGRLGHEGSIKEHRVHRVQDLHGRQRTVGAEELHETQERSGRPPLDDEHLRLRVGHWEKVEGSLREAHARRRQEPRVANRLRREVPERPGVPKARHEVLVGILRLADFEPRRTRSCRQTGCIPDPAPQVLAERFDQGIGHGRGSHVRVFPFSTGRNRGCEEVALAPAARGMGVPTRRDAAEMRCGPMRTGTTATF